MRHWKKKLTDSYNTQSKTIYKILHCLLVLSLAILIESAKYLMFDSRSSDNHKNPDATILSFIRWFTMMVLFYLQRSDCANEHRKLKEKNINLVI